MSITYEFDLNHYRIRRSIYNLLDMIGDVGALSYGLFLIFTFFM